MADPRRLRPSEMVRLLNSTPLGEVASESAVRRWRLRWGSRVGDERTLDLLRLVGLLAARRHQRGRPERAADPYQATKARAAARSAAESRAGRDIGELPPAADPARRAAAGGDFRRFCDCYFPALFSLEWSADHVKVLGRVEQAVLRGGLFAMAMPRGSGKSTICEVACVWAILYGHREFVCLIGSDEAHAAGMLDSIKVELSSNDYLAADFPEVAYPIAALDGIANRCSGQLYRGERTRIGWTADQVVLPSLRPAGWDADQRLRGFLREDGRSLASGAVLQVAGLTGRIRGMKFKRADGRTVRPSLVILDDPQTDDSARSLSQCATREAIVAGAVLGLAGPGVKMSGIMPCTVIRPGDMADHILDRQRHPEWNGERMPMVYRFPDAEALWRQYAEARNDGLRRGDGGSAGTAFYAARRQEMDAGAEVAWLQRHNADELSAVQHAMNLLLQDEAAFWAEYQNDPRPARSESAGLSADQVAARVNRHPRGVVPAGASRLTAMIDVQKDLLYYAVCGWHDDFTGHVIDYGAWPDQGRAYFTLRDARPTLAAATGVASLEGSLFAGLTRLAEQLLGRPWPGDGGGELRVERLLVDANWGESTDVVYRWCRQTPHAALVTPSHGKAVGASGTPMDQWQARPGERRGPDWVMPPPRPGRVRHVLYDTNAWKTAVAARLQIPPGERGGLDLFGDSPAAHRLVAEHLCAEYRVRTSGRGREVDEWKLRPTRPDNHWLDCLVGCAVAASLQGVRPGLPGGDAPRDRRRVSWAELQRRRREAR